MATSGSKSVSVTSYDTLKFSWELDSQSVSNNTSTVSWKMQLISTSAGKISSSASKDWSVTVNGTKYSGTNTVGIAASSTKTLASGTTTIKHNNDGTKTFSYSFSQEFAITFSGSSIGTKSGSGSGTLTTIPRAATITSANNFTDDDNPVIKYSNSAGSSVSTLQACIASSDGSTQYASYRDISKTGSSYTFSLTTAERNALRNACSNAKSMTVRFYVKTTIGDNTYRSYLSKTLTIANAAPTVTATAKDVGTASTVLTGDASKIIKAHNYVSVNMSATALKGASIKSYKITNGSKSITAASGSFSNTESGKFVFTATDSRGYTTSKTINLDVINYVPLTCNLSGNITLSESDNTKANLTFTMSGNYFNGSFGAIANTLSLTYELIDSDGGSSIVSFNKSQITISGNTYKLTQTIQNLDYTKSYQIIAKATDKIYSNKASGAKTFRTTPIFDWGKDDFAFNVPVYIKNNGTNYNLLGAMKALTTTYNLPCTVTLGSNYSAGEASAYLVGNCLRMYMNVTRSSAITAGNPANETVMTINVKHDGKIDSLYRVGFAADTVGGVATFSAQASTVDDNNMKITVILGAAAYAGSSWNGYWVMPANIRCSKYV